MVGSTISCHACDHSCSISEVKNVGISGWLTCPRCSTRLWLVDPLNEPKPSDAALSVISATSNDDGENIYTIRFYPNLSELRLDVSRLKDPSQAWLLRDGEAPTEIRDVPELVPFFSESILPSSFPKANAEKKSLPPAATVRHQASLPKNLPTLERPSVGRAKSISELHASLMSSGGARYIPPQQPLVQVSARRSYSDVQGANLLESRVDTERPPAMVPGGGAFTEVAVTGEVPTGVAVAELNLAKKIEENIDEDSVSRAGDLVEGLADEEQPFESGVRSGERQSTTCEDELEPELASSGHHWTMPPPPSGSVDESIHFPRPSRLPDFETLHRGTLRSGQNQNEGGIPWAALLVSFALVSTAIFFGNQNKEATPEPATTNVTVSKLDAPNATPSDLALKQSAELNLPEFERYFQNADFDRAEASLERLNGSAPELAVIRARVRMSLLRAEQDQQLMMWLAAHAKRAPESVVARANERLRLAFDEQADYAKKLAAEPSLKYFLEELSLIRGFLSYYRGEQAELRETLERLGIEVPVQGAASIKGSHADDSKDSAQLAAYLLSRASQPALVSNSLATLGSDVSRLELSRWLPIIAADAMLIGDHELARNALTRLNQLVPTHPVLDWVSLIQDGGLLAEKSNENELAAKDAERALEAGAVKYAERVFRRLVLANPEFASGWVGLGNVEAARGHHELAAEHYRRALQIANQNVEAQLGLADLMWGAGNEEEAATLYRAVARRCEANCPHRVSERAKLP